MADDDTIVVTEEARDMMRSLETHDPGGPSVASISEVTGAHMSDGGKAYLRAMKDFAEGAHAEFEALLSDIRNDCAKAVKALEDLNSQDQEIMAMLINLDESTAAAAEVSQAATPSTGGPTIAPAGGGPGKAAW